MIVTLKRHHLIGDPNWIIVSEDVPLGTAYKVLDHFEGVTLLDQNTGKTMEVDCYLVDGNGDTGMLPVCVFENLH